MIQRCMRSTGCGGIHKHLINVVLRPVIFALWSHAVAELIDKVDAKQYV